MTPPPEGAAPQDRPPLSPNGGRRRPRASTLVEDVRDAATAELSGLRDAVTHLSVRLQPGISGGLGRGVDHCDRCETEADCGVGGAAARSVGREGNNKEGVVRPTNEYVLNVAFVSFMGFVLLQTAFAVVAKSQAMLADSEAMAVDALTYLFNLVAERLKSRPLSPEETEMTEGGLKYRRRRMCLLLELVPPLVSVTTLIVLTGMVLREAMGTLMGFDEVAEGEDDDEPSVVLMFTFSGLNLLLDVVNVTCFARANLLTLDVGPSKENKATESAGGGGLDRTDASRHSRGDVEMEKVGDIEKPIWGMSVRDLNDDDDDEGDDGGDETIGTKKRGGNNLNMCSAFTHVCADTMRSVAVLIAAGVAGVVDSVDPEAADATAAVVVSAIIVVSLLPLFQGLARTWSELRDLEEARALEEEEEGRDEEAKGWSSEKSKLLPSR